MKILLVVLSLLYGSDALAQNVTSARVEVTHAPTLIADAGTGELDIRIQADTVDLINVGSVLVTDSTGYEHRANDPPLEVYLLPRSKIYAISDSAADTVSITILKSVGRGF